MAAAPIYGSLDENDAVARDLHGALLKATTRQLAAGAIALLGLVAVNAASNATLPTRAVALTATEAAKSCPASLVMMWSPTI